MAKIEVIEVDGVKLDRQKLMKLRIPPDAGGSELRLILPTTSWNTSGKFMTHALDSGQITQIENIVEYLRGLDLLDEVLTSES